MYPGHACWIFDDFANRVDSYYGNEIQSIRAWRDSFQTDIFETIKEKEGTVTTMYSSDHDKAMQALTDLTNGFADRALDETRAKLLGQKSSGR